MKKKFLKTLAVILLLFLVACLKEQTKTLRVGMDLKFYPFTGV